MMTGTEFVSGPAADPSELGGAEQELGVRLPADYRALMLAADGGEGFVGEHYLVLWRASELARFNREYEFPIYAPKLIAFGGDGGGEGFAFDTRTTPYSIVIVPFIGMSHEDAIQVAPNFDGFIERLKTDSSIFD